MVSALLLAAAALLAPQSEVQAEASVVPLAGGAADEVVVLIDLDIAEGWHLYAPEQDPNVIGIRVSAKLGAGLTATGDLRSLSPIKPHLLMIGGSPQNYSWLEGEARVALPARLETLDGLTEATVTVDYQVCDESVCLSPEKRTLALRFDPAAPGEPFSLGGDAGEKGAASLTGSTQEPGPSAELSSERFQVRGRFASTTVEQGGTLKLLLETELEPGWHIYDPRQDPEAPGIRFGAVSQHEGFVSAEQLVPQQEGIEHIEDFGGGLIYTYLWVEGSARFEGELRVNAAPGEYEVPLRLQWQVCDESVCLDTQSQVMTLPITVVAPAGGAAPPPAGGTTETKGSEPSQGGVGFGAINVPAEDALQKGFWNLIWVAVLAGLATILTPCVFPMIPITVSFFTKRAEQGKGTALGNASAYALGIIVTFVGLGIGAAALLGASGANQIASNAWVNLAIAALFVFLAFSLLGFFDIKPPKFLANFASKTQAEGHSKAGYAPVMLMAVAFSVTAFTCTVAFVGTVLSLAATSGEWWYATAAMFAYALVFALPFFFLALFPNMLQKMPTAGGWMNAVKVSFGFLELIAAWKFLSATDRQLNLELLTRPVVIILTAVPLLLWAAYMFGLYMTKGDYGQRPPRSAPRLALGAVVLAGGIYVLSGFPRGTYEYLWMEAYLPPEYYGRELTAEEQDRLVEGVSFGPLGLLWHEGWESALEEGRKQNSVVFLDFTGITCVNCMLMEGNIFPKEGVAERIESMVRAHLYVDKAPYGPENTAFQERHYKGANQPYYAIMDPFTQETLATFPGYDPDAEKFAAFLQEGIDEGMKRGLGVVGTQ